MGILVKFIAIFCTVAFQQVTTTQVPITVTITGTTMTNSRLNLCFNLGSSRRSCTMKYSSSDLSLDETYSPQALDGPVTVTVTGSYMTASILNICIIDGSSSNDCIIRFDRSNVDLVSDNIISNDIYGLSSSQGLEGPVRVTIVGSGMSGSVINLYLVDGHTSYSCIVTGVSKNYCSVRSLSSEPPINGKAFAPKSDGPITITITGGSFEGKDQTMCINTGGSVYVCTITGNVAGFCTNTGSTQCN